MSAFDELPTDPPIAHIAELWRYPVKSMRGEQVVSLDVLSDGIAGDRRFAIESTGAPAGKPLLTGRERAAMLLYTASLYAGGVRVTTPQGQTFALADPELLATMAAALPQGNQLMLLPGEAPLTDCRPISLLSRETIEQLSHELAKSIDSRRFRANIVLAYTNNSGKSAGRFPEDSLTGRQIRIGAQVILRITERDPRCRIIILDPNTTEPDPALMKHLDRMHEGRLGVYASTVLSGRIAVGDAVRVVPESRTQA